MWVRIRDKHILAIDRETYISDDRFFILKPTNKNAWTLRIRYFVNEYQYILPLTKLFVNISNTSIMSYFILDTFKGEMRVFTNAKLVQSLSLVIYFD